ncbi:MAG: hypothetical protein ACRDPR_06345 [Nocardioidaceae bacterium]
MEINIRLPRVAPGAVSNLVGLLGLLGIVVAVGGLTGNVWWSVLTGGVFAVALAWIAQTQAEVAEQASPAKIAAVAARPTPVAKAS